MSHPSNSTHLSPLTFEDSEEFRLSRRSTIIGMAIVLLTLGNSAVLLRGFGQWRVSRRFYLDDWLLLFALGCTDAVCALYLKASSVNRSIGPTNSEEANIAMMVSWTKVLLKIIYITTIFNQFILVAIRLSLLILYRRLLVLKGKYINIFWWANIIYTIVWAIASTVYNIFHCHPPTWYWERVNAEPGPDGSYGGHCDAHYTVTVPLMFSLPSDLGVWLLPIIVVSRMQLARKRKIGLTILFSLGLTACACELGRIIVEYRQKNTTADALTVLTQFSVLSMAEYHLGIFCACLPLCATLYRWAHKTTRQKFQQLSRFSYKRSSEDSKSQSSSEWSPVTDSGNADLPGRNISQVESASSWGEKSIKMPRPDIVLRDEILVTTHMQTEMVDRPDPT